MRPAGLALLLLSVAACHEIVAPAATPPPLDAPAAAHAPAGAPGFPALERAWGPPEYAAASQVLEALRAQDPGSLPRLGSPVFARLVDRQLLASAVDPRLPLQARGAALMDLTPHVSAAVRSYVQALASGAALEGEMLAVLAFALHLTRLEWGLADELSTVMIFDAARLGGVARMRRGSAEQLSGAAMVVSSARPANAADFVARTREDLAALARRLSARERETILRDLASRRALAAEPARRDAFDALLAAMGELPSADFTVTARAILARDMAAPLVTLPADLTTGAAAKDKRHGPNDLLIVPLAQAAAALPAAPLRRAVVAFEPTTPYRLFFEVLYSLAQGGVVFHELRTLDPDARTLFFAPQRFGGPVPDQALPQVWVGADDKGIGLTAAGMHIAPGCNGPGRGQAVPKVGQRHDLGALAACLRRVRGEVPAGGIATITASAATPVREVFDIAGVARGPDEELFSMVQFGAVR